MMIYMISMTIRVIAIWIILLSKNIYCLNWYLIAQIKILYYLDFNGISCRIYGIDSRSYSVRECYELCFKEKLSDGFVISISAKCELFTKGCTKSNDRNWSYYAMATCHFGKK